MFRDESTCFTCVFSTSCHEGELLLSTGQAKLSKLELSIHRDDALPGAQAEPIQTSDKASGSLHGPRNSLAFDRHFFSTILYSEAEKQLVKTAGLMDFTSHFCIPPSGTCDLQPCEKSIEPLWDLQVCRRLKVWIQTARLGFIVQLAAAPSCPHTSASNMCCATMRGAAARGGRVLSLVTVQLILHAIFFNAMPPASN